jgi:hypothetical protein
VLIAYQSGTAAEETEAKEDSEVVSEAIAFLQTVYKNSAKPLKVRDPRCCRLCAV